MHGEEYFNRDTMFALMRAVGIALSLINFYVTAAVIVVTLVILIFSDNALEDWLSRCCFSKMKDRKKYQDLNEEITTYYAAIKEVL